MRQNTRRNLLNAAAFAMGLAGAATLLLLVHVMRAHAFPEPAAAPTLAPRWIKPRLAPEPPTPDSRFQRPPIPVTFRRVEASRNQSNPPPATGWTTVAKITEVYDGDTITVEVTRRFRVRLLDCWAPEIRTKDAEEKARGLEATAYLTALAEGREAILHVPMDKQDAASAWSMSRILGHVWVVGDDRTLSERMVEARHATKTKH